MKKKKLKFKVNFIFLLIGIGLILFAVIPTPDDVTVISPVIAFGAGMGLIYNAFK